MSWLSYSDDEVKRFHPAFEIIAHDCLKAAKLDESYEWVHHDASSKGGIPDYILQETATRRWILVVEIKKTRAAVSSSSQYRRQAHSYAIENKNRFRATSPFLYCLTNLEQTQLFGANDQADLGVSPNARLVQNWNHGEFDLTSVTDHKKKFAKHLSELISLAMNARSPLNYQLNFPSVWDTLELAGTQVGSLLPKTWSGGKFSSWFSTFEDNDAKGLLLVVQCLLAEWIVYQSEQHGHPNKASLIHLKQNKSKTKNKNHVADVIDRILKIDFEDVLGGALAPLNIRGLSNSAVLNALSLITGEIQQLQFDKLTDLVGNSGLPDLLFDVLQERVQRSRRGTVQTDPELANVAATLAIYGRAQKETIIDPCAGIGNLVTAAYNARNGLSHSDNIQSIIAIEIEPIQSALAGLQLLMQAPSAASKTDRPVIICDSVSNSYSYIEKADIVLLNPPYKRYEEDSDPLPSGYRAHLEKVICAIKGKKPITTSGQSDLYNHYVELVISSMAIGARGVFILNNKWMNTKTTLPLRKLLINECTVEALIQYPHSDFFKGHMIATSLLIFEKGKPTDNATFHFVRCLEDLRSTSVTNLAQSVYGGHQTDKIKVATHKYSELERQTLKTKYGSWRTLFSPPECLDVLSKLPLLTQHFESVVQGRLERDEVSSVISFPFRNWEVKGTKGKDVPSCKFIAGEDKEGPKGALIHNATLKAITNAAKNIPDEYRGYAIKVSHKMGDTLNYELTSDNFSHSYKDGSSDAVIEPPDLRKEAWNQGTKKAKWNTTFESSLQAMRSHPTVGKFINLVENQLGLDTRPAKVTWEDLLRPCAGEIILLRSFRTGWRAHLNPLAFKPKSKQLRVSSNFYSFRNISTSTEKDSCVDREEAARVVLAFLLSSFGQIQFEFYGENREGLRKCEKGTCIENVHAPHPASIDKKTRTEISKLINELPCPIDCEAHPHSEPKRRELDLLIGAHLLGIDKKHPKVVDFVNSTSASLDELQRERLG
jgi:hypothetical protein